MEILNLESSQCRDSAREQDRCSVNVETVHLSRSVP